MAKKMLNPNTTLWAVDADDVTDITNITASTLQILTLMIVLRSATLVT